MQLHIDMLGSNTCYYVRGYNMMVAGIAMAQRNNSRIISVRGISGMIHRQYQVMSRAAADRDASLIDTVETENGKIGLAVDRLASQSEDSERAELEKLKGLTDQSVEVCRTGIAKGIERTDPTKYNALLADFSSSTILLSKETELKNRISGGWTAAGFHRTLTGLVRCPQNNLTHWMNCCLLRKKCTGI